MLNCESEVWIMSYKTVLFNSLMMAARQVDTLAGWEQLRDGSEIGTIQIRGTLVAQRLVSILRIQYQYIDIHRSVDLLSFSPFVDIEENGIPPTSRCFSHCEIRPWSRRSRCCWCSWEPNGSPGSNGVANSPSMSEMAPWVNIRILIPDRADRSLIGVIPLQLKPVVALCYISTLGTALAHEHPWTGKRWFHQPCRLRWDRFRDRKRRQEKRALLEGPRCLEKFDPQMCHIFDIIWYWSIQFWSIQIWPIPIWSCATQLHAVQSNKNLERCWRTLRVSMSLTYSEGNFNTLRSLLTRKNISPIGTAISTFSLWEWPNFIIIFTWLASTSVQDNSARVWPPAAVARCHGKQLHEERMALSMGSLCDGWPEVRLIVYHYLGVLVLTMPLSIT